MLWEKQNNKNIGFDLYSQVDDFFEQLQNTKILEYREGQHTMALDVADAISNKEILLIEAGVGIGKSYAYLIPILYAYQNDPTFHGFLLSTSTIALQEQLKRDIEHISEILGMSIPVTVAKGKTNYVCLKKIEELMEDEPSLKDTCEAILKRIKDGDMDAYDFSDIDPTIWKKIHITNCCFDRCSKFSECPYIVQRKAFTESNAVICNHDLLIQNLKRESDEKILNHPNLLVIDEAHNLEEKVRKSCQKTLNSRHIENIIYNVYIRILKSYDDIDIEKEFFDELNGLFIEIHKSAKMGLTKNAKVDSAYEDSNRISFSITPKIQNHLQALIGRMQRLLKKVSVYESKHMDFVHISDCEELKETIKIFQDMLNPENCKNIYWCEFLGANGKYVQVVYAPKNIDMITSQLLSDPSYGKILTSATLTTRENDYSYYSNSIGLHHMVGINVIKEYSQKSPFDYQNNSLIYYGTDIENPKNREVYLEMVLKRIQRLLEITNGRGLVLFTSKKDMKIVYEGMKNSGYPFPIYVQEEGKERDIIQKFQQEQESSLFGTGVFWEGLDIKGASLSQVIIPKLPFPIVEPVIEAKASIYANGFQEIYMPEMIMRLKQGVGRLIRNEQDTGIISILDSRVQKYDNHFDSIIRNSLPNANITTDLREVEEFSKEKILSL